MQQTNRDNPSLLEQVAQNLEADELLDLQSEQVVLDGGALRDVLPSRSAATIGVVVGVEVRVVGRVDEDVGGERSGVVERVDVVAQSEERRASLRRTIVSTLPAFRAT